MRIYYLLFIIHVILLSGCSEILYPEVEEGESNCLVEVFGHNRCVNCPFADDAADSLYKAYPGRVFVLQYHYMVKDMPEQFRDTLSPQPETNNRWGWYDGGDAFPTTFINGTEKIVGADENIYTAYASIIDVFLGQSSPVQIELENIPYSNTGILRIGLSWTDTTVQGVLLFCLIAEDSVVFVAPGAADTLFNHVVRGFYPDGNGIAVNALDTLIEVPYTLEGHWEVKNLEMVVFIQDPVSKEVLQVKGIHF